MAASWPSAKKTFTQVVNGITKVVALLWNGGYDELEALETYIGAPGEPQTKLAALNCLFKDRNSLLPKITWIDDDTIEIASSCVAMYDGNDYVIKELTSALQIKISANLDTGSEASSTVYYVYLCGDSSDSQYTAVFSVSASAPTGYTYFKRIGCITNDGSSNLDKTTIINVCEKSFGAWESKSDGTAYQAATDGFFVGGTSGQHDIFAYTDSSNPPTTMRQEDNDSQSYHGSFCLPVRAGDYYKSSGASYCFWIPITSLS